MPNDYIEPSQGTKRLVTGGIFAIARKIGPFLRNGKPIPTVIGALLLAGAGATLGLIMIAWIIPGLILGGLVGATVAAALFPKNLSGHVFADSASLGAIRKSWTFAWSSTGALAVLLERALYVVVYEGMTWNEVQEKLAAGVDPNLPGSSLIYLNTVEYLQSEDTVDLVTDIYYRVDGKLKVRGIVFSTSSDKAEFLDELAKQFGGPFVSSERPETLLGATWAPLTLLIVFFSLTIGAVILSSYWIANPPGPIARTGKQDGLVQLLTWAGPYGALLAGAILIVPAAAWFLFRMVHRPRVKVLKPASQP